MSERSKFWMVYGMGQHQPTVRHKSIISARQEAERLARSVPGVDFFVLETVGAARKVDVEYLDFRGPANGREMDDEIPF